MTEKLIQIYECEECSKTCILAINEITPNSKMDLPLKCSFDNKPKFKMILSRSDFWSCQDKPKAVRKLKEALNLLEGLKIQ